MLDYKLRHLHGFVPSIYINEVALCLSLHNLNDVLAAPNLNKMDID